MSRNGSFLPSAEGRAAPLRMPTIPSDNAEDFKQGAKIDKASVSRAGAWGAYSGDVNGPFRRDVNKVGA